VIIDAVQSVQPALAQQGAERSAAPAALESAYRALPRSYTVRFQRRGSESAGPGPVVGLLPTAHTGGRMWGCWLHGRLTPTLRIY
jgi:hypothetical protein